MNRRFAKFLALCCILMLLLTGCGTSSTIESKPFDVDGAFQYSNLLNADFGGFAFHFQDDIQGQLMTQEIWQNGERTATNILWYGGANAGQETYYLAAFRMQDEQGLHHGQELRGIKTTEGDTQTVHRTLAPIQNLCPQPVGSYGYYFMEDTLKVEAGGSYILALWDMEQNDDGHQTLDLEKMHNADYPEQIKDCDYVILLKMQLFATEAEAEAAVTELY